MFHRRKKVSLERHDDRLSWKRILWVIKYSSGMECHSLCSLIGFWLWKEMNRFPHSRINTSSFTLMHRLMRRPFIPHLIHINHVIDHTTETIPLTMHISVILIHKKKPYSYATLQLWQRYEKTWNFIFVIYDACKNRFCQNKNFWMTINETK